MAGSEQEHSWHAGAAGVPLSPQGRLINEVTTKAIPEEHAVDAVMNTWSILWWTHSRQREQERSGRAGAAGMPLSPQGPVRPLGPPPTARRCRDLWRGRPPRRTLPALDPYLRGIRRRHVDGAAAGAELRRLQQLLDEFELPSNGCVLRSHKPLTSHTCPFVPALDSPTFRESGAILSMGKLRELSYDKYSSCLRLLGAVYVWGRPVGDRTQLLIT